MNKALVWGHMWDGEVRYPKLSKTGVAHTADVHPQVSPKLLESLKTRLMTTPPESPRQLCEVSLTPPKFISTPANPGLSCCPFCCTTPTETTLR